jgi:hypothetical protein
MFRKVILQIKGVLNKAAQYKVLTQRDRRFSGKFNPEALELAINGYAVDGWVVKAAVTAEFKGGLSTREELIVIMEKVN